LTDSEVNDTGKWRVNIVLYVRW